MSSQIFRFQDREVRRGLRGMRRAGADLRPVLRRLRRPLREDLDEHAQRETGDEGGKWPRRTATTARKTSKRASTHTFKRGRGSKAVREQRRMTGLLGKLPAVTNIGQRGQSLRAINPVDWSAAHNEGDIVGRGSVLPQREFVFFSDPFLDRVDEDIVEYVIERGWERG